MLQSIKGFDVWTGIIILCIYCQYVRFIEKEIGASTIKSLDPMFLLTVCVYLGIG